MDNTNSMKDNLPQDSSTEEFNNYYSDTISTTDSFIEELARTLYESWYTTQDHGKDTFTVMMYEEVTPEQNIQRIKTFEASCYYVIQNLVYGGSLSIKQAEKLITEISASHLGVY